VKLSVQGLILWILDLFRSSQQSRRKVSVLVHQAKFVGGSMPYYFVKVTNLSPTRETEITHVWFDTDPPVHLLSPDRPLPARLRPDETWEAWVEVASLVGASNVERLARVRLPSGKVVTSRPNKNVPPIGYVAGSGSR
jgi:hypothetical protein